MYLKNSSKSEQFMSIDTCQDTTYLHAKIKSWRDNKETIAFVPTMGNLHDGHLSLVQLAQKNAARVIVSIYVNPLQFSPDEDFGSYPRTLDADLARLEELGVDLVFMPDTALIYPQGEEQPVYGETAELFGIIEGEFRPHFFRGVATVVLKLFKTVQPDIAVFGEKDFQQLLVVKALVKEKGLPIEIIAGETKREHNGLAMSSRNNYLSDVERNQGKFLSEALQTYKSKIEQGSTIKQAESASIKTLESHGLLVDYVTLRETSALKEISDKEIDKSKELIVLAGVKAGKIRLIDNLQFTI